MPDPRPCLLCQRLIYAGRHDTCSECRANPKAVRADDKSRTGEKGVRRRYSFYKGKKVFDE